MAKEPDNLVLEHLRAIRVVQDHHSQEFADVKVRLSIIEQHTAGFLLSETRQNSELDKLRDRVERIEKRLEVTEPK